MQPQLLVAVKMPISGRVRELEYPRNLGARSLECCFPNVVKTIGCTRQFRMGEVLFRASAAPYPLQNARVFVATFQQVGTHKRAISVAVVLNAAAGAILRYRNGTGLLPF